MLPCGTIVSGLRLFSVNHMKFMTIPAYEERMTALLKFAGIPSKEIAERKQTGKWSRFAICTCHWPKGSFFVYPNGKIGIFDHAYPKIAAELVESESARTHVDDRVLANVEPLTAMTEVAVRLEQRVKALEASCQKKKCVGIFFPPVIYFCLTFPNQYRPS